MKTTTLSQDAKDALISIGTNRQGAKLTPRWHKPEVVQELVDAGLVGPGFGLTRPGTIARERAENELEAATFGKWF